MFLQISDSMTVGEVQERFNECFPFLDIAFYSRPHLPFEGSDQKYRYGAATRIADIRKKHVNGVLEIKSWNTTADVEQKLKEIFGLNIQIFHYDPLDGWLQTTISDSLTLKQLSQFTADGLTAHQSVGY